MLVTSKLCNDRAYIWGTLAQFQSSAIFRDGRDCWSCYTDCSCLLFFSEMHKASTFLDLHLEGAACESLICW